MADAQNTNPVVTPAPAAPTPAAAPPVTGRDARIAAAVEKHGPVDAPPAEAAAPEAPATPPAEQKPEEGEEKKGPLDKQWKALSKKAREMQTERENYKVLAQQHQQMLAEYKTVQGHLRRLREDPIGALQALGTPFEVIAQRVIDSGKPVDPQQQVAAAVQQTQAQVEQLKVELAQRQKAQEAQQIAGVRHQFQATVAQLAAAETWMADWAEAKDVNVVRLAEQVGEEVFKASGQKTILTPAQAFEKVKAWAQKDLANLRKKFGPQAPPNEPTLTNRLGAESANPGRRLTREERIQRAAVQMNQTDREQK